MEEHNKEVEQQEATPKKKKSGALKLLYWLVVIGGCTFIFLGSYKIGYKLGNYFGEKDSETKANNKSNDNSNVESNSNSNSNEVVTSNKPTEPTIEKTQKSSVPTATILVYYKDIVTKSTGASYSVADLNKDGIPELLIFKSGVDGGIECETTIYTYDELKGAQASNYIVNAGVLGHRFDNDTTLYTMADGKFVAWFMHMGSEITWTYDLKDSKVVETNKVQKDTNASYQGTEPNGTKVKFVQTTDLTLINNYK